MAPGGAPLGLWPNSLWLQALMEALPAPLSWRPRLLVSVRGCAEVEFSEFLEVGVRVLHTCMMALLGPAAWVPCSVSLLKLDSGMELSAVPRASNTTVLGPPGVVMVLTTHSGRPGVLRVLF